MLSLESSITYLDCFQEQNKTREISDKQRTKKLGEKCVCKVSYINLDVYYANKFPHILNEKTYENVPVTADPIGSVFLEL